MSPKLFDIDNQSDDAGRAADYHDLPSLGAVFYYAFLSVVTFSIVIPTAERYAEAVGISANWFGGLSIGATVFAAAASSPIWKLAMHKYNMRPTFMVAGVITLVGAIMYATAQEAHSPALLLIGRIVSGTGTSMNLRMSYYACSCSRRKLTGIFTLDAAIQALAYSAGPFIAFLLSLISDPTNPDAKRLFNVNSNPGWFLVGAWATFVLVICVVFVEPDKTAGHNRPKGEDTTPLLKDQGPERIDTEAPLASGEGRAASVVGLRNLAWSALCPLCLGIFVMPCVFGAFEVITIHVATEQFGYTGVTAPALYLAVVMLVCAVLTVGTKPMFKQRPGGHKPVSDRFVTLFFFATAAGLLGLVFVVLDAHLGKWGGMVFYAVVVSLACTGLNIARAGSMAITAKPLLCPAELRDNMMSVCAIIYMVGRGLGPLLASAISTDIMVGILAGSCAVVALAVGLVYPRLGAIEARDSESRRDV